MDRVGGAKSFVGEVVVSGIGSIVRSFGPLPEGVLLRRARCSVIAVVGADQAIAFELAFSRISLNADYGNGQPLISFGTRSIEGHPSIAVDASFFELVEWFDVPIGRVVAVGSMFVNFRIQSFAAPAMIWVVGLELSLGNGGRSGLAPASAGAVV